MGRRDGSAGRSGMGMLGVLGLIFLVLKLTGHITWSWVWVLAPFWVPVFVIFAIALVIAIYRVCEEESKK